MILYLYICVFKYLNIYLNRNMAKIIHISEAAAIAIRSMVLIANCKEMLNVNDIAESTPFSKNHIAKILQTLTRYGYLSSVRGPKGGFLLKKKAGQISLLEIYELIEGEILPDICEIKCEHCSKSDCLFGGLTIKFTNEFRDFLKKKKLSDA
jgi:Rrf2 family protein